MSAQIKCRPMGARNMCAYSEDFPKSFYLSSGAKARSVFGESYHNLEPIKDSFWVDLGGRKYRLTQSQNKDQRLIFKRNTPATPHRIRYIFTLSSVSSGSITPTIFPEISSESFSVNGEYTYDSQVISSASGVGFKASSDFSGVIEIKDIYHVKES